MPIRYAELMGEITGLPPLPIAEMGPPVLTPLRKPLAECTVALISTAGIARRDDVPFDQDGEREAATSRPGRSRGDPELTRAQRRRQSAPRSHPTV